MERIAFIGRLRKRGVKYAFYEIAIPMRVIREYNLRPGELFVVELLRLGTASPGWYMKSFNAFLSNLLVELEVMVRGDRAGVKDKMRIAQIVLEELRKYVGRNKGQAPQEAVRYHRGQGEETGANCERLNCVHDFEGD